jgi:two-component system, OmpR family, sensor histidine kinase SaeS
MSLLAVTLVTLAGIAGTVLVGAAGGMHAPDLTHLLVAVVIAAGVTAALLVPCMRLIARVSLRRRFVAAAVCASAIAIANLAVLTALMAVEPHDAALVLALLVYASGMAAAAAMVLARRPDAAIGRLVDAAKRLGDGDLNARVGVLRAGEELDALAATFDDMAARLQVSAVRERTLEARRRDLITMVSHDLRTPLASLRVMVEAIDDGVVDDRDTVERYVAEMRRATVQLTSMVDDLFELSQLDAGAIAAETARVPFMSVASSAIAAVAVQAERKGLHLDADVVSASEAVTSPRVERVLQNLLVNAVRHTPADGTVRLSADLSADRLSIAVEDTGPGIDEADLRSVFEPFFRGDPARSGQGAGLGLALAKRIVEALGGSIQAANREPSGARFEVVVPIPTAVPAGAAV